MNAQLYIIKKFKIRFNIYVFNYFNHHEKFLGTPRVRRNGAPLSHIHGGLHHEFN